MIKCDYFGKLSKQGFFILLISCFILLGGSFVNGATILKNGQYYPSNLDNAIDINVNNKGQLMSQRLGITKRVLSFISNDSQKVFFWRGPLQRPYIIVQRPYRTVSQGYVNHYYLCDELTGDSSFFSNCTSYLVENDFGNEFSSFFNSITINDYWGYDIYSRDCASYYQQLVNKLCFSSSQFHRSICFSNGVGSIGAGCFCENCYDTTGSLNIDISRQFTAIPDEFIGTPPGYGPIGSIDGGSSIGNNVSLTGNVMYNPCTNGYIINKLKYLYGDSLDSVCYAGTYNTGLIDSDFSGVQYIYNYGLNYRDLFKLTDGGMSWGDWFSTYENDMLKWKSGRFSVNPFLSQPVALYSYFENLYNNGYLQWPDNYDIGPYAWLNFCNLYLYSDLNGEYKGTYFKPFCDDLSYNNGGGTYNTGEIGNIDDGEVLPPGYNPPDSSVNSSGTIVSVDWSGTLSGNTNQNFDGKTFINNFYQKLQSKFQNPVNNFLGVIPGYILFFMFSLILFRFLSH